MGSKSNGKVYDNCLVISDTHFPYHHQDTMEFLLWVYQQYDLDTVIHVGDIFDHHRPSRHVSETDSMSSEDEYYATIDATAELAEMFPEMLIAEGNHDCIPKRQIKELGLAEHMVKSYQELYGCPDSWVFSPKHYIDIGNGNLALLTHSISSNVRTNATKFSHCSIQGHHHSEFGVHFYADHNNIRWAMGVGALLDPKSPAARYGASSILKRPILGCGVIQNGWPLLVPMILNSKGRWIGG